MGLFHSPWYLPFTLKVSMWILVLATVTVQVAFRHVGATISRPNAGVPSQHGGSGRTRQGGSLSINPLLPSDPNFRERSSRRRQKPVEPYRVSTSTCKSVPNIRNRDTERMRKDCVDTKVGERCRISCIASYQPSIQSVKCLKDGFNTNWDLNSAKCEFNEETVCRDKYNMKVGWFIVYRFPSKISTKTSSSSDGERYIYMSDKIATFENKFTWERDGKLNTPKLENPLNNTLAPLSSLNRNDVMYAMYSDQYRLVEDGVLCTCYVNPGVGHAKGVVMSDNRGNGVFMVHSQPNFPGKPGRGEDYSTRNGQIFMCISFDSKKHLETVKSYISMLRANVYASRNLNIQKSEPLKLPEPSEDPTQPGSQKGTSRRLNLRDSINHKRFVLPSSNRQDTFDLIAKLNAVDIYSEVLAPIYNTKFDVVTWRKGSSDRIPETSGVKDIKNIRYFDTTINLQHAESKEHSKWAVSGGSDVQDPNGKDIFCVSDLNRVVSQKVRGGGAVCIRNYNVARAFRIMVSPRKTKVG